jgi:hypothetical protein
MRARRTIFAIALSVLVGGVGMTPGAQGQTANQPPTGRIDATLTPPYTGYVASITDPEGDSLTYSWSATISCGSWEPDAAQPPNAEWWHGEPGVGPLQNASEEEGDCVHSGVTQHAGTFTVEVNDGQNVITCRYEGAQSGTGPPCTDGASAPSTNLKVTAIGPDFARTNRAASYRVVVRNLGPDAAVAAFSYMRFLTFEANGARGRMVRSIDVQTSMGRCNLNEHTWRVSCEFGTIPVGGEVTVRARVRIGSAFGRLTLGADADSGTPELNMENNHDRVVTRIRDV